MALLIIIFENRFVSVKNNRNYKLILQESVVRQTDIDFLNRFSSN